MEGIVPYKKHATSLLALRGNNKKVEYILPDEMWRQVEELLAILKPIKICTVRLQDPDITASDFFMEWFEIKLTLEKTSHDLAISLVKLMIDRERDLFSNRAYLACIFIDPRCNIMLLPADIIEAKKLLVLVQVHLIRNI